MVTNAVWWLASDPTLEAHIYIQGFSLLQIDVSTWHRQASALIYFQNTSPLSLLPVSPVYEMVWVGEGEQEYIEEDLKGNHRHKTQDWAIRPFHPPGLRDGSEMCTSSQWFAILRFAWIFFFLLGWFSWENISLGLLGTTLLRNSSWEASRTKWWEERDQILMTLFESSGSNLTWSQIYAWAPVIWG